MALKHKWSLPYKGEMPEHPEYERIIYEKDPPIGRIILNVPEKHNPVGYELLQEIELAAREMELDDDIKVIIIKGNGKSWSSGYDTRPAKDEPPAPGPADRVYQHPDRSRSQHYNREAKRVFMSLWDLQKPIIAQIHGYCMAGGSELAMFCDLRIVAEDATICWLVGHHTPGDHQLMPWLTSMAKAKYYMLTNMPMDGKEAYRCDWASAVFPADKLEEETEAVARQIAQAPSDLLMLIKKSINRQYEIMGFKTGMESSTDFMALSDLSPSRKKNPVAPRLRGGRPVDVEGPSSSKPRR